MAQDRCAPSAPEGGWLCSCGVKKTARAPRLRSTTPSLPLPAFLLFARSWATMDGAERPFLQKIRIHFFPARMFSRREWPRCHPVARRGYGYGLAAWYVVYVTRWGFGCVVMRPGFVPHERFLLVFRPASQWRRYKLLPAGPCNRVSIICILTCCSTANCCWCF